MMSDHINPALRERLEARRESTRAAVAREQRAQQQAQRPYRHTQSDSNFWAMYLVIVLVAAFIIGELVQ